MNKYSVLLLALFLLLGSADERQERVTFTSEYTIQNSTICSDVFCAPDVFIAADGIFHKEVFARASLVALVGCSVGVAAALVGCRLFDPLFMTHPAVRLSRRIRAP